MCFVIIDIKLYYTCIVREREKDYHHCRHFEKGEGLEKVDRSVGRFRRGERRRLWRKCKKLGFL